MRSAPEPTLLAPPARSAPSPQSPGRAEHPQGRLHPESTVGKFPCCFPIHGGFCPSPGWARLADDPVTASHLFWAWRCLGDRALRGNGRAPAHRHQDGSTQGKMRKQPKPLLKEQAASGKHIVPRQNLKCLLA